MKRTELNADVLDKAMECSLFKFCDSEKVSNYLKDIGAYACDFDSSEVIPAELRRSAYGIIISGSVKIFSGDRHGNAFLMNVVSECEPFDISALIDMDERQPVSFITTAGRCRIVFVPTCPINQFMLDYPEIAANCFRFFCGRIEFLNQKIHSLSCGSSNQKLVNFLLNEFYCEDGKFMVRIKSCVELADRLNVSRASLYRAMDALKNEGIISHSGKIIVITDIAKLQER